MVVEKMSGNATLLLIPSQLEYNILVPQLASLHVRHIELCGFGPVVAGIRTAELISRFSPEQVILVGIAGKFRDDLQIGAAYEFRQVACFGIGVGSGEAYRTAGEMGWRQWPANPVIGDTLSLTTPGRQQTFGEPNAVNAQRLLLTACSASGSAKEAAERLMKFPDSAAEDMEGFAVTAACMLAGVPLRIIRGISNQAGNRRHSEWKIEESLQAAADLVRQALNR